MLYSSINQKDDNQHQSVLSLICNPEFLKMTELPSYSKFSNISALHTSVLFSYYLSFFISSPPSLSLSRYKGLLTETADDGYRRSLLDLAYILNFSKVLVPGDDDWKHQETILESVIDNLTDYFQVELDSTRQSIRDQSLHPVSILGKSNGVILMKVNNQIDGELFPVAAIGSVSTTLSTSSLKSARDQESKVLALIIEFLKLLQVLKYLVLMHLPLLHDSF
ncbi:hypothetical protein GEMRC1_003850 [Eukaryota sp. GEM-RC1]